MTVDDGDRVPASGRLRMSGRPIQSNFARSYDAWADEYDRFRPGYPNELFATIKTRLRLPRELQVIDLGAGTGRVALAMAALGWYVTAVEPGSRMLDQLARRASIEGLQITTVRAGAEETGLAPASADLVTAGQAFHWFDGGRALVEIARLLRPEGGVALFWNVDDVAHSKFLADYAQLLERSAGVEVGRHEIGRNETRRALEAAEGFSPPVLIQLHHEMQMTDEQFIGMAFTASYVRVGMSRERQDRFRRELTNLLRQHGLSDGQPFPVPQQIDLWIAQRQAA